MLLIKRMYFQVFFVRAAITRRAKFILFCIRLFSSCFKKPFSNVFCRQQMQTDCYKIRVKKQRGGHTSLPSAIWKVAAPGHIKNASLLVDCVTCLTTQIRTILMSKDVRRDADNVHRTISKKVYIVSGADIETACFGVWGLSRSITPIHSTRNGFAMERLRWNLEARRAYAELIDITVWAVVT